MKANSLSNIISETGVIGRSNKREKNLHYPHFLIIKNLIFDIR